MHNGMTAAPWNDVGNCLQSLLTLLARCHTDAVFSAGARHITESNFVAEAWTTSCIHGHNDAPVQAAPKHIALSTPGGRAIRQHGRQAERRLRRAPNLHTVDRAILAGARNKLRKERRFAAKLRHAAAAGPNV